MRVIAGSLGGRKFTAPKAHVTHPMAERTRGALFNMLDDLIVNATVLDAFSGSGALAFEALSRGAKFVTLIEKDRRVADVIAKNITDLDLKATTKLIRANANSWSNNNPDQEFDILLLDPPYDKDMQKTVDNLKKHVSASGIMVLSNQGRVEPPSIDGVVVVETRSFGDSALHFYRRV